MKLHPKFTNFDLSNHCFHLPYKTLLMSRQKKTGNKGEEIAQEYLRTLGYEIIETNWRSCYYEIGFIARDKDGLVIIEVKARGSDTYEHPSEAVSDKKTVF